MVGYEAEGSQFKGFLVKAQQNMEGVVLAGGGVRSPSEHRQGAQNARIGP